MSMPHHIGTCMIHSISFICKLTDFHSSSAQPLPSQKVESLTEKSTKEKNKRCRKNCVEKTVNSKRWSNLASCLIGIIGFLLLLYAKSRWLDKDLWQVHLNNIMVEEEEGTCEESYIDSQWLEVSDDEFEDPNSRLRKKAKTDE